MILLRFFPRSNRLPLARKRLSEAPSLMIGFAQMKELFREVDLTIVGYMKSILESEGIATVIRNEHLCMAGLSEVPIPDFFPALNVIHDEDYQRALQVLKKYVENSRTNAEKVNEEVACHSCGEVNPGNFEVCWSCESSLALIGE